MFRLALIQRKAPLLFVAGELFSWIEIAWIKNSVSKPFFSTLPISGIDFICQTVDQGEYAFLMAMGTVIKKTLRQGESILVDGDSVLAFESSVTVDVRTVGNIAAICCSGNLFYTELSGPGVIYLQSMSIDKLRRLFPPSVSSSGDGDGGDGEASGV